MFVSSRKKKFMTEKKTRDGVSRQDRWSLLFNLTFRQSVLKQRSPPPPSNCLSVLLQKEEDEGEEEEEEEKMENYPFDFDFEKGNIYIYVYIYMNGPKVEIDWSRLRRVLMLSLALFCRAYPLWNVLSFSFCSVNRK